MKVTEVHVEKAQTFNLGNYESLRLTIGMRAEVQDGETEEDVTAELIKRVDERMMEDMDEFVKKMNSED